MCQSGSSNLEALTGGNCPQEEGSGIAVEVEIHEAAIGLNILLTHVFHEGALTTSWFTERCDVHHAG